MDPRLYRCARRGNVRSLKRLLDETPSLILGLTPQENSIVHIASQFGHVSVVQEICTRCKSLLTKPNIDGDTPLHVAARAGQLGVVSSLLKQMIEEPAFDIESGGNCRLEMVMWKNKRDNTALHVAIGNGHLQAAELLLEVNPQLVHYANHDGESPLYLAARGGMVEIVNRILMFPSAPSGGCHGQTALHAAVIERNPGIVQSLLRVRPELINAMDHEGRNAVHYAASSGEHKMVEKLLEFDFSSAYATDRNGHSPLQAAALLGHTKVISGILRHCPDSGEFLDLKGQNALHLAVLGGKAKVVSRMLEMEELEGLINQPDKNGNTPLHLAAVERNTWIMRYLLWDGRVDRKAGNMSGLTALDFVKPIEHPNRIMAPTFWGQSHSTDTPRWFYLKKADSSPNQEDDSSTEQTYKQRGQTLLMVATLLTAVTFAAVFTMPGGYNNNLGPDQGVALLQSSKYLKRFIISDTVAMTSSITAACVILWGAVVGKRSYVYYYSSAMVLTYIALQLTYMAFTMDILAVLPDQVYVHTLSLVIGIVLHISTFLFLFRLAKIFSISEVCMFLVFRIRKLNRRICTRL
ncbi:hypothetical protein CDL15_Pgr002497 [Punica granatum]|uniref:PGG domain-containing protein n=1 Tax=Punica granatum TaxID=22663 RepID=A0A218XV53_PUNGR|nr:hypothetical protein CDL15_Pgr002497 [Punica granatum]PKI32674.1 hypothetical protein CRG98_046939 [Punica granatum]